MPLLNVELPTLCGIFFGFLMKIAAFDPIPIDNYLDEYTAMTSRNPINTNFEAIGFEPIYLGCYLDKHPGRQLERRVYKGADNTPEKCEAICRNANYSYFGLQYGKECFCGNALAHLERKAESDLQGL